MHQAPQTPGGLLVASPASVIDIFPGAVITDHHRLGGLDRQKCILSHSGGQKSVWAGPCSLRSL